MPRSLDDILDRLAEPAPAGFQDVIDLVNEDPDVSTELVVRSVRRLPRGSTAVDAVVAFVPDGDLPSVADEAVASLRAGAHPDSSQAALLIARLSLQAPSTLQPYLPALWDLRPNGGAYYGDWPWRGAQAADVAALEALLASPDADTRRRAWRCLVESRSTAGWAAALVSVGAAVGDDWRAGESLLLAGVERQGDGFERLFVDPPCHIVFPAGFLRPFQWHGVQGQLVDPTWKPAGPPVGTGRFGGVVEAACKVCGGRLHRLVAIDEAPPGRPAPLELVTCMSCVGWSESVLFFSHRGPVVRPAGWEVVEQEPEVAAEPLPEVAVTFVESSARWRLQDWALSNGRENLNRLGGEPTWIQSPDFPHCPDCGRTMRFLLQLDSFDLASGPEWLWGSGGVLYTFWCDGCAVSATLWQCT